MEQRRILSSNNLVDNEFDKIKDKLPHLFINITAVNENVGEVER